MISIRYMGHNLKDVLSSDGLIDLIGDRAYASSDGRRLDLVPELPDPDLLDAVGGEAYAVLLRESHPPASRFILRLKDNSIVWVTRQQDGGVVLTVLSEHTKATDVLTGMCARLEPHLKNQKRDDGVWVNFMHMSKRGLSSNAEFVLCPRWGEIAGNYPDPAGLGELVANPRPWASGRAAILHGPSGTGKTYFVRSLMLAWKDIFDFAVILDPEVFASDPEYYYGISDRMKQEPTLAEDEPDDDYALQSAHPWTRGARRKRILILLEDSADLILEESRKSHFDKVGKLLNMTDGLFGQGREDLLLFTFNEDVQGIDPAFLRPGRCVANIRFPSYDAVNGLAWLRERGVEAGGRPPASPPWSLADLYAVLGRRPVPVADAGRDPVGFASRRK